MEYRYTNIASLHTAFPLAVSRSHSLIISRDWWNFHLATEQVPMFNTYRDFYSPPWL